VEGKKERKRWMALVRDKERGRESGREGEKYRWASGRSNATAT
jgi:hypothetical protein